MIMGFYIVHYGSEYFEASLEALCQQVDKIVILYTPKPSQGHGTNLACPDSRANLRKCASRFLDKIIWVDGEWPDEGSHVNAIWAFADKVDWIVRCDTDEIFPDGMVAAMIEAAQEFPDKKCFCVPFIHHWKSFSKVVNNDGQMPVRLMRHEGQGDQYLHSLSGKWAVHHMGYAQADKFIAYKLCVSGHKPEFRPDWYINKWLANAQEDLHPVCTNGFWNAQDFDKTKLPQVLWHHPNYWKDVI